MPPELPKFELDASGLLRGLIDGTIAQIWEFWGDGEYPDDQKLKEEADCLVDDVLASWSDSDLVEFGKTDSWVKAGLLDAGIDGADDPIGYRRRRMAMRIGEVALEHARYGINRRALLQDPLPTDRTFQIVPDLWQALAPRHFLMPLTPESVPTDIFSSDPFFYFGDYAVFPHPYLRGTRELCFQLSELALNTDGVAVQVAIDPHRVLPRDDVPTMLLEDYWYGLKVTRENLDSIQEHDLGRSVHWRNLDTKEGQRHEAFYPLIATEFDWSAQDGTTKVLQVEEIRPGCENPADDQLVLNRYLHSERDTVTHVFTHLDGALKGYPACAYRPSRDEPLARRGKAAIYRKLFRVDGQIPDDAWGMEVGQFFRQNELVAEHLGEIVDERTVVN